MRILLQLSLLLIGLGIVAPQPSQAQDYADPLRTRALAAGLLMPQAPDPTLESQSRVLVGQRIFDSMECGVCHDPEIPGGWSRELQAKGPDMGADVRGVIFAPDFLQRDTQPRVTPSLHAPHLDGRALFDGRACADCVTEDETLWIANYIARQVRDGWEPPRALQSRAVQFLVASQGHNREGSAGFTRADVAHLEDEFGPDLREAGYPTSIDGSRDPALPLLGAMALAVAEFQDSPFTPRDRGIDRWLRKDGLLHSPAGLAAYLDRDCMSCHTAATGEGGFHQLLGDTDLHGEDTTQAVRAVQLANLRHKPAYGSGGAVSNLRGDPADNLALYLIHHATQAGLDELPSDVARDMALHLVLDWEDPNDLP